MKESEILEKLKNESQESVEKPLIEKPREDVVKQEELSVPEKIDLFNFLDIDMNLLSDEDTNKKVSEIADWVKIKKPEATPQDIVLTVQEVQSRLARDMTKNTLEQVWEYVFLDKQRMMLYNKMKLMEK